MTTLENVTREYLEGNSEELARVKHNRQICVKRIREYHRIRSSGRCHPNELPRITATVDNYLKEYREWNRIIRELRMARLGYLAGFLLLRSPRILFQSFIWAIIIYSIPLFT
jgi:thiamine kinase-like enzyme